MSNEELTYEKARNELIEIVNQLESSNLELDKSMELYKRGKELSDFCSDYLEKAKKVIAENSHTLNS
jgi:exodeoxyribonuclease VII small subunit